MKTLEANDFSFKYPAEWTMTNRSGNSVEQYNLTPPKGNALIIIQSPETKIDSNYMFFYVKSQIRDSLYAKIIGDFNRTKEKAKIQGACLAIDNVDIPGRKITGNFNNDQSSADLYNFAINKRFYNFIYLRSDKDGLATDKVWEQIAESFSAKNSRSGKGKFIIDNNIESVTNAKIKNLVKPDYPRLATRGRKSSSAETYSTEITVDIIIDEKGNLESAQGVYGRTEFFFEAQRAAKLSSFEPAIVCGKPGKFYGTITYNFVE